MGSSWPFTIHGGRGAGWEKVASEMHVPSGLLCLSSLKRCQSPAHEISVWVGIVLTSYSGPITDQLCDNG